MSDRESNSKRIMKNTLMLYFRQIVILFVSLYTVRVVLGALGEEDYGIYNIVGGVVVLFTFINNAMAQATQRFLNYSLGLKDDNDVSAVFSSSLVIHISIAVLFLLLAESVGLWFVNSHLNIPEARMQATRIVYQFTILTSIFNIARVPYHSAIIAYERMGFFAGVSIIEAFLKVAVAFLISRSAGDRLILYAFLIVAVSIIMFFVYWIFCRSKFAPIRYRKVKDIKLMKRMMSFSGWSLFGASANMCSQQGTNIVLNMFTNVSLNAAMGIANQVNSAVYSFVHNFRTAFNPQIVKSWAAGDKKYFDFLLFGASKASFFLCLYLVIPIYISSDFLLGLWLKEVPAYTATFVRLILLCSLVESMNGALVMAIQAYGNIRKYQLIISCMIAANLPLTIIAFICGAAPDSILMIRLILDSIITLWRIWFLRRRINISARKFILDVVVRCLVCGGASFVLTWLVSCLFHEGWTKLLTSVFVSLLFTTIFVFFFGLTSNERSVVNNKIKAALSK